MEPRFPPVLLLLICAAVAPVIAAGTKRFGVSVVVIELLLGVALGPQGLALMTADTGALPAFATLGLAFLFFIAGLEIDLPSIRGKPLRLAFVGWVAGVAIAIPIAFGMRAVGLIDAWLVVTIALMTTALGALVPIMRDGGVIDTPFGRNVLANGVMGELGPILAISLIISRRFTAGAQAALTLAFIGIVLLLVWLMTRGGRVPAVLTFLKRDFDSSGQTPIRLSLVLIVGLAVLAEDFGLDLALGALAAGMMVGYASRGGTRMHDLHTKVDAVGFGFLVPLFLLSSGMKLDLRSVVTSADGLALVAIFLIALVIVRLPLVLLLRRSLGTRNAAAVALLSATTVSLIVVIAQVAVKEGVMPASQATPLVVAGMLTVILFPAQGFRLAGVARASKSDSDEREGL